MISERDGSTILSPGLMRDTSDGCIFKVPALNFFPFPPHLDTMPAGQKGANYRTECTGEALKTVQAHQKSPSGDDRGEGLHLFGASRSNMPLQSKPTF